MAMETSEIQQAIAPLVRGLDKMENQLLRIGERIDQFPTVYMSRTEYEARHADLMARVNGLQTEMTRMSENLSRKVDDMEKEQTTRGDRLWMRLGPAIAALAFLLTLYQFLSHVRFTP